MTPSRPLDHDSAWPCRHGCRSKRCGPCCSSDDALSLPAGSSRDGTSGATPTAGPSCTTPKKGRDSRSASTAPLPTARSSCCLLYTSDAADDLLCVDLGG